MSTRSGTGSALLVVDVQAGVVAQAWDRDRIVGNVALAVQRARESGVPVVWVQHHDEELERESPAWQWVPELEPGRVLEARNVIADLNIAMRWLAYPGRRSILD